MKEAMEERKQQEVDRENRDANIVFFRAAESTKETVKEKIEDDTKFFNSLCSEALDINNIEVDKVIRLGQQDGTKCRPLKIVFKKQEDKGHLMKSLNKLKNADEKFKGLSITHDYNKEDRSKIKAKVEEAKKMGLAEDQQNFNFRVRGPPWDLRIVKFPK